MADQLDKYSSNVYNKIVERQVDYFYANATTYVTMSFQNFPNIDAVDIEIVNEILADAWAQEFPEDYDIVDFMKHCIYHTGMIGRFYRVDCSLPLDDVFYFLKNRVPNPDSSFKIWNKLHKLARLLLNENRKESSSDVTLILDVHTDTVVPCDILQNSTNSFNLEEFSIDQDSVLVFHVTVFFSNHDNSLPKGPRHASSFQSQSELSKPSNYTTSSKQSESLSKSSRDSKDIDPWQKYGAKPKNKQYLQKSCPDATSQMEHEVIDNLEKSSEMCPRLLREEKRVQKRLKLLSGFEKINEMIEEKNYGYEPQSYQNLSLPPCPNTSSLEQSSPKKGNLKITDNIANRETPEEHQNLPLPSCSTISRPLPFNDEKYFRNLIDTSDPRKVSNNKLDSIFTAPYIPLEKEDSSYYQQYGARPKTKQFYRKCDCEIFGKRSECKMCGVVEEDSGSDAASCYVSKPSKCIPGFEGVFKTEKELAEMPESMREAQLEYEKAAIILMKSECASELSVSNESDNQQLEQALKNEQSMSDEQRNPSLQMPFICYPPDYVNEAVDNENSYTFNTPIGLQVRESIIRYEVKMFFEMCPKPPRTTPDKPYRAIIVPGRFDKAIELRPGDEIPGHLAIEDLGDKLSFEWEPSMDEENIKMLEEIDKSGQYRDNKKVFIVDGEKASSKPTDEMYNVFFQNVVKELTKDPSVQEASVQESGNSQSSPHKHSSPEKKSKYADLLKMANVEEKVEVKFQDSSEEEELLYFLSEGSPDITDCESLTEKSASESDQ